MKMNHFFRVVVLGFICLIVLSSCNFTPKHDHDYVVYEMREPTKTQTGYRKYRCSICGDEFTQELGRIESAKWAGVRASSYGMYESYGSYPDVDSMIEFGSKMESCYSGGLGTYILIVGTVDEDTWTCHLGFPLSQKIDKTYGTKVDMYEEYLSAMDAAGYSVWLQVEPGDADLVELATEVMNHYKQHSCVKGFGIDVEWYKPEGTHGYGTKLSEEPETSDSVLAAVKAINSDYTVFVKHWDEEWLPDANNGFIYVNDSQGFRSGKNTTALERMCTEFAYWAEHFSPCPVMFQIGYDADRSNVWGTMDNPAKELGQAIIDECKKRGLTNDIGIIWVDFTLKIAMRRISSAD